MGDETETTPLELLGVMGFGGALALRAGAELLPWRRHPICGGFHALLRAPMR